MSPFRYFLLPPLMSAMLSRAELEPSTTGKAELTFADLSTMDAHAHVFTDSPAVFALLERLPGRSGSAT